MRMFPVLSILVLIGLAFSMGTARAQCATAVLGPRCIPVCPSGDLTVSATFVDAAGVPCPFEPVGLQFRPGCGSTLYVAAGQPFPFIPATTDAFGVATWTIGAGGCCLGGAAIWLDSAGSPIGNVPLVVSPDMDASGVVNLADFVAVAAAFLSTGANCADYDCDGTVALTDVVTFAAHWGH